MGPHHPVSCFCLRTQQQQVSSWGNLTVLLNLPQVCWRFKVPEQYINRKRPGLSIDQGPVNLKLEQDSTTWATLPGPKHPRDYQYRCPKQMFKEVAKSIHCRMVWDSIGPCHITLLPCHPSLLLCQPCSPCHTDHYPWYFPYDSLKLLCSLSDPQQAFAVAS